MLAGRVIGDASLAERLGHNARLKASRYSCADVAKRTLEVYTEVAKEVFA